MARIENVSELLFEIEQGNIGIQKHPTEDLYLLWYTDKCSFSHHWTDLTMMCRGLITDLDWNIVQRPFRKFFNYEELPDKSVIPESDNFVATAKIDGSLGILYWIGDTPYITTKGSWTSDQGKHATKVLQNRFSPSTLKYHLDRSKTYLFEIVYPEDKHIVDYGNIDTIVLIGVIDTETGKDYSTGHNINVIGFDTPEVFKTTDWKQLRSQYNGENREGFVVLWPETGFRIKLKYKEYMRLFYYKYLLTPKYILESCMNGKENTLLEEVPFEIQEFVKETIEEFKSSFDRVQSETKDFLKNYDPGTQSSKDVSVDFSKFKYSPVVWAIWNKKSPDILKEVTWKCVKREFNETRG